MLSRLGSALKRASAVRPLTTAVATGFGVMAVGDGAAQLLSGSAVDATRNGVAAVWAGGVSPAFYRWYRLMDYAFAGRPLAAKVAFPQLVTTGLNNPCFIAWCAHAEALALAARSGGGGGGGGGARVHWPAVRAATAERLRRELPGVYGLSMLFWLPVTAFALGRCPDHLRVLGISIASVWWGGFQPHVAHRGADAAERCLQ